MFSTFRTLINGANARAEEKVRDTYALELIDQKIREAQNSLKAAKATLASLIQRQRSEERQTAGLRSQIKTLTQQAEEALTGGREDLAEEGAHAIAQLENEMSIRQKTEDRLGQTVLRLQQSIEAGHRRIIDLKQGAITARAVRHEQSIQARLNTTLSGQSSVAEAEDLIAKVLQRDDPFEQAEILSEIDKSLSHETIADRMATSGFGPAAKTTGADVMARLKAKKKN